MACEICETRRPKRFCPGVRGDICTICCGTEREVSVSCPLDCVHLQEARKHEKAAGVHPEQFPNQDVRVTDEFLHENEELLVVLGRYLMGAALEAGAVDHDVREALDTLVRTYRTLLSGVYYETRPQNPLANAVYGGLQNGVTEFRRLETEARGMTLTRDKQVMGILIFLQRLELDRNNGRKQGRAFIDFLRTFFDVHGKPRAAAPSLIVP